MRDQSDKTPYAFLTARGADGQMTQTDTAHEWVVATARPAEGSLSARELSGERHFADATKAVRAFFALMKTGMSGVIDTSNLREYEDSPLAFTETLTDKVSEACDEIDEEDERADDFDNTAFSELRDAMVDHCREYSGEDPEIDLSDLETVAEVHDLVCLHSGFEEALESLLNQEIGNLSQLIRRDPDADSKIAELRAEMAGADDLEKLRVICGSMGTFAELKDSLVHMLVGTLPEPADPPSDPNDEIAF